MLKKIGFVHLFFLIIALGIRYYNLSGPDLIWNMILALIALDFAVAAIYVKRRSFKIVLGLFWIFFYPNTFYMLTDIVHMSFTDSVLWDKWSLIRYLLYVSSILFGVLCGIESVNLMTSLLKLKNYFLRLVFIGGLSFVSSFAIHIGRYARLNSWDIFTRPKLVVDELLSVVSWDALHFVLGFTFMQVLCLVFLDNKFKVEGIEK